MRHLLSSLALCAALPAFAQEFTTFKGHGGPVMALDVSPEGQLASASFDNSVGLWSDGLPVWLEGHDAAVTALNFERAPMVLSGSDDFRVLAQSAEQVAPTEITRMKGKISAIAYGPDADTLAISSWDGSIALVTGGIEAPETPEIRPLLGHRSNVTDVGFSTDGRLFSASSDGTLRVWDRDGDTMTSRVLVRHGFGVNRLIVTDVWIAYGAVDGGTRVMTREGDEIADFTLDRRPILSMDYHADSQQLAVGDGHGYIMMIDTATWRITRDFRAMRRGPVWALAFSRDGSVIHAGGLDDAVYAWPVALLDRYAPAGNETRSFLRDADSMENGERQFMRKCSICHSLEPGPSRRAGPTLHGLFGRAAGTVDGYRYSQILDGSAIVWEEGTIDALFDQGPDHYIPGSKMPMQVIAKPDDRADLIDYLKRATGEE